MARACLKRVRSFNKGVILLIKPITSTFRDLLPERPC